MSRIPGGAVVLFLLFIWAGGAGAANCTVSTTAVNFGSYDVLSASPTDSTGEISIYCSSNNNYVTGSIGPSFNSGGFDPRQMKLAAGTELMDYNLYIDASRTQIWGDGTGGTSSVSGEVPRKITTNYIIYGRIPAGLDISAGFYTEVLSVTIEF